jgi:hypothetical protein
MGQASGVGQEPSAPDSLIFHDSKRPLDLRLRPLFADNGRAMYRMVHGGETGIRTQEPLLGATRSPGVLLRPTRTSLRDRRSLVNSQ